MNLWIGLGISVQNALAMANYVKPYLYIYETFEVYILPPQQNTAIKYLLYRRWLINVLPPPPSRPSDNPNLLVRLDHIKFIAVESDILTYELEL